MTVSVSPEVCIVEGDMHDINFKITGLPGDSFAGLDVRWAMSPGTSGAFSATAALEKTVANGGITLNNNCATIALSRADTAGLGGRTFYQQLRVFDASGEPVVVGRGDVRFLFQVLNTVT